MHVALKDKVSHKILSLNYIAITILVLISVGLMMLYGYMLYTVARLTSSYKKFVVLKIDEMKDEPWRFLLADKKAGGSIFQRHFNLINLGKDILNCFLIFFLYNYPTALVAILLLTHLVLLVFSIVQQPFIEAWQNRLLIINNVMYILIDLMFLVTSAAGKSMSLETRYYFIGFTLIVLVSLLILANIGFSFFYSLKDAIQKVKKWLAKRKKNKTENSVKFHSTARNDRSAVNESVLKLPSSNDQLQSRNQERPQGALNLSPPTKNNRTESKETKKQDIALSSEIGPRKMMKRPIQKGRRLRKVGEL